jgi:hypothetical protein
MFNFEDTKSVRDAVNAPNLLLGCHRARYAELLSPAEVAETAAVIGIQAPPQGWAIHAELSSSDIERLTQEKKLSSRLMVLAFESDLPIVVLTTQLQGIRFQWVVALWEADAQLWLRDSVKRGRIALMLSSFDSSACANLMTSASAFHRDGALLQAATVQKQPPANEHLLHILNAGLSVMNDTSARLAPTQEPMLESRVMVAGRGANAVRLMNTFIAGVTMASSLSTTPK